VPDIARAAVATPKKKKTETTLCLLIPAGRLHIDETPHGELKNYKSR
jgi:hypothetical protein